MNFPGGFTRNRLAASASGAQDAPASVSGSRTWRERTGTINQDMARALLEDPRLLTIDPAALGVALMVQAYERVGRPIPLDPAVASRLLGLSKVRLERAVRVLSATTPPLLVTKDGCLSCTPFGAPVDPDLSQRRSLSARKRWSEIDVQTSRPSVSAGTEELESIPALSIHPAAMFEPASPLLPKGVPPCPYDQIREAFNSRCTSLAQTHGANTWSAGRRSAVANRWSEHPDIAFWEGVFDRVEASNFLTGRERRGDRNWKAGFDWIFKPANLTKIIEGNYDNFGLARRSLWHQGGSAAPRSYGDSVIDESAAFLQGAPSVLVASGGAVPA